MPVQTPRPAPHCYGLEQMTRLYGRAERFADPDVGCVAALHIDMLPQHLTAN